MDFQTIKEKIEDSIKKAKSYGELTPDQLNKLNYKFRLEWNYNSNSMEGNTLTKPETRSIIIGNLDVYRKPIKDVFEINGHDIIIHDILRIGKGEMRLSEKRIKDIHTGIMYEEDSDKKALIGKWKIQPNGIINYKGEKQDFIHPDLVAEEMHNLLNRTNAAIDKIISKRKDAPHPLDIAFDFHLEYLKIHPFYDGNGRTARILTNLILISLGYPPFWIKENERQQYYRYITDIQSYGGDKDVFYTFLGELVLRSQELVLKVILGMPLEEEDDLDKEVELIHRKLKGLRTEGQVLKSSEIRKEVYNQSLKGLFLELDVQARKFQKIFENVDFQFFLVRNNENKQARHDEISYKRDGNYEELFNAIDLNEIDGFVLYISFEQLKNIERHIGLSAEIDVDFYTDSYKVYSNDVEYSIKKLYSEVVEENENKKFASEIIDALKKHIEDEITKETN